LELVFAILLLTLSVSLSSFVIIPWLGTLVRFRANFTPKGLQLDQDGGAQPHVGPVVKSYLGMLLRTKRIEGWGGLFKGVMPMLFSSTLLTLFAGIIMGASFGNPRAPGRYNVPESGSLLLVLWAALTTMLTIPFTIITNRAITTPRRLSWWNPVLACQVILTPLERKRPWILYKTPGLLAAQVLHILYVVVAMNGIRQVILPPVSMTEDGPTLRSGLRVTRIGVYVVFVLLSVMILCPLEVISTRLSLQKNHSGSGDFTAVPDDESGLAVDDDGIEYSGQDEDVVGLRSEEDPYIGLVDCCKRIVDEEGTMVLYRAWWLTFLAALSSVFT